MAAKTRLPLLAMAALALATAVFGAGCAFFVPVTQHGGAMSTAYCPLPLLGQPLLLLGLAALVPALVGALYHIPTNASAAGRALLQLPLLHLECGGGGGGGGSFLFAAAPVA